MSLCKRFGLAIFAAVCLLAETAGSAHAQCTPLPNFNCATEWSGGKIINLGGETTISTAAGINDAGQAVGQGGGDAVIWSGGNVINLGPGEANGINDAGQVAGLGPGGATEWSGGKVISLGGLPGSTLSDALAINNAGQVVGYSVVGGVQTATEWSGGTVINLGGLPGFTFSYATAINEPGRWWELVGAPASRAPLSGAAIASSTSDRALL
jgi:probable HAF family extracellular repeat protein